MHTCLSMLSRYRCRLNQPSSTRVHGKDLRGFEHSAISTELLSARGAAKRPCCNSSGARGAARWAPMRCSVPSDVVFSRDRPPLFSSEWKSTDTAKEKPLLSRCRQTAQPPHRGRSGAPQCEWKWGRFRDVCELVRTPPRSVWPLGHVVVGISCEAVAASGVCTGHFEACSRPGLLWARMEEGGARCRWRAQRERESSCGGREAARLFVGEVEVVRLGYAGEGEGGRRLASKSTPELPMAWPLDWGMGGWTACEVLRAEERPHPFDTLAPEEGGRRAEVAVSRVRCCRRSVRAAVQR